MNTMQKPYLHLLHVVNQHTFAYTLYRHIQTFLTKNQVECRLQFPISIVPPYLHSILSVHLKQPELHTLDHLFPRNWDIVNKKDILYFLTRFKTSTNNLNMTFTLKLGKTQLGVGTEIPDDYRKECRLVFDALL